MLDIDLEGAEESPAVWLTAEKPIGAGILGHNGL
jgi:hypothetical protein